jgi:hypothetical protein
MSDERADREPGGLVPPYEGRQEEGEGAAGTEKAFHPEHAGEPGPGREVSEEEREGVPATDTEARTPLGVGESLSRRGEDRAEAEGKEPGRQDAGTKGESDRPVGTSDARDATSVDPQEPTHPDSPTLPPGDQAG